MLDLSNIQGNILRGYASFPEAHFHFLDIQSAGEARAFIQRLLNDDAVTRAQWPRKPDATLNVALSFEGLRALGLPEESLATFPAEFQEGMRHRAKALGDVDGSSPDYWDDPWKTGRVHMLVMIYSRTRLALEEQCQRLREMLPAGVRELGPSQPAGLLTIDNKLTRKEHFGFLDGISNPDVQGVPGDDGNGRQDIGNPDAKGGFRKIPIGEFILGHPGDRIGVVALLKIVAEVDPILLYEFELVEPGIERDENDTAPVLILLFGRQIVAVGYPAPDQPVPAHGLAAKPQRVAGIGASYVRAQRAARPGRIVGVGERIVGIAVRLVWVFDQ